MAAFGAVLIVFAVIVGLSLFLYYFPLGMWIRTIAAGVPLSIMSLIRMRLIGIQPAVIVNNLVRARKAGLDLTVDQMQSHYLAGGNVENVVLAMIAAERAQIPLEWQRAAGSTWPGATCSKRCRPRSTRRSSSRRLPGRRAERHPAQRQGARDRAHQPRPLRRGRRRADGHRARRRGVGGRLVGRDARSDGRVKISAPPPGKLSSPARRSRSRTSRYVIP